jgi:opacity protein-like surface antigen
MNSVRWMLLAVASLAPSFAFSGVISFGAKGGVPLTDAFKVSDPSYFSDSRRYTAGPVVEVNLPFRLSVEFDALYRPLKYGFEETTREGATSLSGTASSWSFPLLLKYRLTGGPLRPYLGAGFAFHHLSGLKQLVGSTQGSSSDSSAGVVLEGGLELRAGFVRVSPEIRYTRWGSAGIPLTGFSYQENQAEFLIGIMF